MKPRPHQKLRWFALALACATGAAETGCSKQDDVANQRRAGPLPTEAGLTVEVAPPTGITLGLDGNKLASQAPWTQFGLEPGMHTLLVRGMGYLPVEMPVTLVAGQTLKVAVSLRPRPPELEEEPPPPVPMAPRRALERSVEARLPPPPPMPEIGPELPPGAEPISLQAVTQPEASVVVDDEAVPTKVLALHHTYGIIVVGPMKVRYNIGVDRILELTLADDTATWQRDTLDVSPGAVLRFNRGFTRLRRVGSDGDQSIILRWIE